MLRTWLFHPVLFYPALVAAAALLVFLSLRPDLGPLPAPAPMGAVEGQEVVLAPGDLIHPIVAPPQIAHASRDALGRPVGLRIAVTPGAAPPNPSERGVRLQLRPEAGALLAGRRVRAEVDVRPVEITTAAELALSLQDEAGDVRWVRQPLAPAQETLTFILPPTAAPTALGVRVISIYRDYNYGVEIASIRLAPAPQP